MRESPPNEAVIVTVVALATADVVTVKFALVAPAGTVTVAGVVAAIELLESVTAVPPEGAALVNVTVPVVGLPLTTLVGLTVREESMKTPQRLAIPLPPHVSGAVHTPHVSVPPQKSEISR